MATLADRIPLFQKINSEAVFEKLDSMAPRERNLLLVAVGVGLLVVVASILQVGFGQIKRAESRIQQTRAMADQIDTLVAELQQKNQKAAALRGKIRPAEGFYLSSIVENQAARFQLEVESIGTESRSDLGDGLEEVSTDVKLSRISYPKMLNLLEELEGTKDALVRIRRLRIRSVPQDPLNLEIQFKVSAYLTK